MSLFIFSYTIWGTSTFTLAGWLVATNGLFTFFTHLLSNGARHYPRGSSVVTRSSLAGDSLLHATLSVEDVGGRQDTRTHHGPGRGAVFAGGEASEEKTFTRVLVG